MQDAWTDVRGGFEAQQQQGASASAACGPIDTSLGTAPHPAVRIGTAGLSEAFQTPEAVAAAWVGAQDEAEVFAERLGDEGLLDTSSLHRFVRLGAARSTAACVATGGLTRGVRCCVLAGSPSCWRTAPCGCGKQVSGWRGSGLCTRGVRALCFSHVAALCCSPTPVRRRAVP